MASGTNGMGGAATPQAGAPNTNLSQLFMQNAPAGGGAQLPQITAPVRPPMQTPPRIPLPQTPGVAQNRGSAPAFTDMSFAQRLGSMMGGKFDPRSGQMNLPSGLDRGSAIAARNLSKNAMINGQQNPFGRNPFNPQGGSR